MIQGSLLMLWMDENVSQQSNKNRCQKKTYYCLVKQQPNWLELLLYGEKKQVHSTGEVCWKYCCILLWF